MRAHWHRDKEAQQNIDVQWERGDDNNADYHTKHHPIKHHRNICSRYVLDNQSWGLRVHCLRDKEAQQHIDVKWE